MQEPLLKNSHELKIGQKVRVVDEEVLEQWNGIHGEQERNLDGYIADIDGQDICIQVRPDKHFGVFWNIDFSVNLK
jgi:hypothetical protein